MIYDPFNGYRAELTEILDIKIEDLKKLLSETIGAKEISQIESYYITKAKIKYLENLKVLFEKEIIFKLNKAVPIFKDDSETWVRIFEALKKECISNIKTTQTKIKNFNFLKETLASELKDDYEFNSKIELLNSEIQHLNSTIACLDNLIKLYSMK